MKKLKQCPFCNGKAILLKGQTCLDNYVMCLDCGSKTKRYNTKESAIKSWNKRNAWIPCKERLPKDREEVLITDSDKKVRLIIFNKWLYENPQYSHNIIPIAWQPLPPKYEG